MADNSEFAETLWRAYLTGDHQHLGPMVGAVKTTFALLPGTVRCRVCNAPFHGPAGPFVALLGFGRGTLNPTLCKRCEDLVKLYKVGLEIEISLLFADVRGSTTLAQEMGPSAFHKIIDRFYRVGTEVFIEQHALIEKLIGDEVAGIFAPGIAGEDHPQKALEAAHLLLERTGHRDPDGPWVPVGVGVHTGTAYVGAVGGGESLGVITVLGDTANTAARLAGEAPTGTILVSCESCPDGGSGKAGWTQRSLELKGRAEPLQVHQIEVGP